MGTEDEGGEGMVGENMIHTEGCPADFTDSHGWLSHRFHRFARISTCCVRGFHGGEPQILQGHADEILSISHRGH